MPSFFLMIPQRLRLRPRFAPAAALAATALAIVAPAFFFLYGLNAFPLRDNNEGLYAEIAREMLAGGNWIVPHLDGVPYIEKPPLLYWLQAMALAAFGVTPAVARLASALPMLALSLGLAAFVRRHAGGRAGCLAGVILASMVPVALGSHLVLFDPLLCALLGGAMLCFLHGALAGGAGMQRLGAVLLALAVLDKGAVALALALGSAGMFLARAPVRWRPARGTLFLFLALVLPWHVLAALRQPGFTWFYVVNEHVLRFLGERLPDDYHRGPPWFYLPRLLLMLAPWTSFLALMPARANGAARGVLLRFCGAALLFPLLFFSVSQAKADYYLIVCAPFLALWLALLLDAAIEAGTARLAWCWAAAMATCIVLLVAVPGSGERTSSPWLLTPLALGWLGLLVPGARAFAGLASPAARMGAVLAIAVLAAPLLALGVGRAALRAPADSSQHIARLIQGGTGPPPAVFIYRDFEDRFATLPFYLGHGVPVIDSASRDLAFGCAAAPGIACVGHAAFLRRVGAGPVAVAVHASRRDDFLALAGPGWRSVAVGDRIVFFHDAVLRGP